MLQSLTPPAAVLDGGSSKQQEFHSATKVCRLAVLTCLQAPASLLHALRCSSLLLAQLTPHMLRSCCLQAVALLQRHPKVEELDLSGLVCGLERSAYNNFVEQVAPHMAKCVCGEGREGPTVTQT